MQFHTICVQIDHVLEFTTAGGGKVHDVAHILLGCHQVYLDERLFRQLDFHGVGVVEEPRFKQSVGVAVDAADAFISGVSIDDVMCKFNKKA